MDFEGKKNKGMQITGKVIERENKNINDR